MELPKRITVGETVYTVKEVDTLCGICGYVDYDDAEICVARKSGYTKRAYKQEVIDDTFWHELVHAILYEMKHKLYNNDAFVSAFANILTKAVNSAEFK